MQYNETISNFLKKINIENKDKENNKVMCYNKSEINPIIARYGMYKNKQTIKVCIADIIGKNRGKTQSLLDELNSLFDENGGSYKRRSVSMLLYDSSEIVDRLKNSFKKEPIELKEIDHGKYIIGNNGMHRANLLRLHYLKELKDCHDFNEIKNLKRKYTIDVVAENIDIIKTYSKYILNMLGENVLIEDEIDDEYLKTDNVVFCSDKGEFKIINKTQLLELVEEKNKELEINQDVINLVKSDKYFREYVKLILNGNLLNKLENDN